MSRPVQRIPIRRIEEEEEYEYYQSPPRRNTISMEQRHHRRQASPAGLSSISESLGRITETVAYNVTNGVNSANRTLRSIFIVAVIGAFLLGLLLMRTIDREILGGSSQSSQPTLRSEKP